MFCLIFSLQKIRSIKSNLSDLGACGEKIKMAMKTIDTELDGVSRSVSVAQKSIEKIAFRIHPDAIRHMSKQLRFLDGRINVESSIM